MSSRAKPARADKLPLKFRFPGFSHLEKSKAELSELIDRHSLSIDPNSAYKPIADAFLRATLRLAYQRTELTGPTEAERRLLAEQIIHLSQRLLVLLTGELRPTHHSKLGNTQHYLFSEAKRLGSITDIVPALTRLKLAASRVLKLDSTHIGGANPSAPQKGRPADESLNALFTELMVAWKDITGSEPKLTVNYDGEVTCPFCLFFHRYFGGDDKRLRARAIADRCSKLTPYS
jgi:hypothetical protein